MPSEIVPHSTYTIQQNRTKIAAGPLERLGIQAHRHGQSTIEPLVSRRAVRVTNGAGIRTKPKDGPMNFHPNHPQSHTHEITLLKEEEAFVPNFVGGSLPRKDAGSREEYCMTMLTLFKPWRSGKDLRPGEDALWDDVFQSHSFTDRQTEIMKFFHIHYECNDARDDFSAQRKQAEKKISTPFHMNNNEMDELDTQGYLYDTSPS